MPRALGNSWSSQHLPVWPVSWHVTSPIRTQCWQTFQSNTISDRETESCVLPVPAWSGGAKMTWNLPKIWEGRMKLKSYSRVQAFFCYSNPVIEAMCSCWFLNSILFWKGQTASLDALSGYRAPKSGELPASFQTSSAKWGDKGICNQRSSLKGMVPVLNEGEHREGVPKERLQRRGKAEGTLAMEEPCWYWQMDTGSHHNLGLWHPDVNEPFTVDRAFSFFICGSTFCKHKITWEIGLRKAWHPPGPERYHWDVSPIMCLENRGTQRDDYRRRVALQKASLQRKTFYLWMWKHIWG